MLIRSIMLKNFLSFGDYDQWLDLEPLNVVIGGNGKGKTNFVNAFEFLSKIPKDLDKYLRDCGGVDEWLFNIDEDVNSTPVAEIKAIFERAQTEVDEFLSYEMSFTSEGGSFRLVDEKIENKGEQTMFRRKRPTFYYHYENGSPFVRSIKNKIPVSLEDLNHSALAQMGLGHYRQIASLIKDMADIRVYKDWVFGRNMPARHPQTSGFKDKILKPDFSNLPTVLNEIKKDPNRKKRFIQTLRHVGEFEDFEIEAEGTNLKAYVATKNLESLVPVSRLSDGTLHFMCLLAILLNPALPPFICIDGLGLGLREDVLPAVADTINITSKKCQIVVTSHSPKFIDCYAYLPGTVMVCDMDYDGTELSRVEKS
ncbi:MAG: AAA family ATPase [Clostridiales bacterium]|jgi:predicted ATPase|nr:AAA family ATPase [Clostridiales bacterium]